MDLALGALLVLLAAPVLAATLYLFVLTLLSGVPPRPPARTPRLRFCVLIPAHDEESGIARTVECARALAWPAELLRVRVIADNCSDRTAAVARAAGAEVLERVDAERRGKGYALEFAFGRVLEEGWADAVVVLDADSLIAPGTLAAMALRLEAGALAVQAFYGVLNTDASWRTRLIAIALALFHRLRGRGRERLGVSCGLRGNGMCLARETLQRVPHDSFSIVEDLEYGIRLGRAGIRVHYADEASVLSDMQASERSSRTQRLRWEDGRRLIAREQGLALLRESLRRRNLMLFDLAMDLLVPPLATVGMACAALAGVSGLGLAFDLLPPAVAAIGLLPSILLVLHVLRGVALSGLGWRGWTTLAAAPMYVLWKLWLKLRSRVDTRNWVRTERPGATPPPPPRDR